MSFYRAPFHQLHIVYGTNKGKNYTEEEDRFLVGRCVATMARFTGCLWCWVNIENCLMTILLLLLLNSWDGFISMAFLSLVYSS